MKIVAFAPCLPTYPPHPIWAGSQKSLDGAEKCREEDPKESHLWQLHFNLSADFYICRGTCISFRLQENEAQLVPRFQEISTGFPCSLRE
jgi:hypothetical protein